MKHGEFFALLHFLWFSGKPRFARVFGLLKMVIFGDEDNMVERFVEIDARVFLDGTLTSRRVFQLTGPGTRAFPRCSWRFRVLTKGLKLRTDHKGWFSVPDRHRSRQHAPSE